MKKIFLLSIPVLFAVINLNCSAYKTIVNTSGLKFRLKKVNNLTLAGIYLKNKSSVNDFSSLDLLKMTVSYAKKEMPISFNLIVEVLNPNNGTGGYPKTNVIITSFPWRLMIDNKEIETGNIKSPITVPGKAGKTDFSININFNLYKLFQYEGYHSLINFALNLKGFGNSLPKLILYAKPGLSTPIGDLSYPHELKIISLGGGIK